MRVEPYLYFNGRCEEAVTFYQQTLDAQVVALARFKDNPGVPAAPGSENKLMHVELRVGASTVLASDGQGSGPPHFQGFSLSLNADHAAEADLLFRVLAEGGRVHVPLGATPFASRFGMVADRLGVLWTIVAHQ